MGPGIAAVMACTRGSLLGRLDHRLAERLRVSLGRGPPERRPAERVEHRRVVQVLLVVVLGRRITATLVGQYVHDDRSVVLGGIAERVLHAGDVVTVDRAGVANAQRLEERDRLEDLAEQRLDALQARVGQLADARNLPQPTLDPLAQAHVRRVEPQPAHAFRRGATRSGAYDRPLSLSTITQRAPLWPKLLSASKAMPPVIEPSPITATTLRSVAPLAIAGGHAVGVGQDRRRVAVLDPVVRGLLAARIARKPARLTQGGERVAPAGDDLVHVGLVAGVPQDDVPRRVEHPVHGERELNGTQIGTEVAAGDGHRLDDEGSDLLRQLSELLVRQLAQVGGGVDRCPGACRRPQLLVGPLGNEGGQFLEPSRVRRPDSSRPSRAAIASSARRPISASARASAPVSTRTSCSRRHLGGRQVSGAVSRGQHLGGRTGGPLRPPMPVGASAFPRGCPHPRAFR